LTRRPHPLQTEHEFGRILQTEHEFVRIRPNRAKRIRTERQSAQWPQCAQLKCCAAAFESTWIEQRAARAPSWRGRKIGQNTLRLSVQQFLTSETNVFIDKAIETIASQAISL